MMEVPDGIPKWSGHKGSSTLMQELSNDEGKMPKYKGHVPEEEVQTGGAEAADESMEGEDEGEDGGEDEGIAGRVRKRART